MSKRLSQSELETYLWSAANILRGLVDAGDYKQYIFPLMFYKRLSDVWDEEYYEAYVETGDEIYAKAMADERFVIPEGTHWQQTREVPKDVGQALQRSMRAIEAANPDKLEGIFGDAPWTNKERLPDYTLKNLLEHFSQHCLSLTNVPEDELGNAYEYLIKQFADDSGHTAQEFYTNRTVVHLMVQMLDPQPGERIYDPTCGTGGMLISALDQVKRSGGEYRTLGLFGQERNHLTAAIARMNLVLHGVDDFAIVRGDTLERPAFTDNDRLATFDVVLANPPYSIKQWNREAWASDPWGRNFLGIPPQGRADYAFFQHILKSMDPQTGRCAILFPHGVLFRNEEADMRRKLIEADLVECVLGLGPNLFYNSSMESCVVICRSCKAPERQGNVLLINAVNYIARERKMSWLNKEHQIKISHTYKAFGNEDGLSRVVSLEDIAEQNFGLSISLFIKSNGDGKCVKSDSQSLNLIWQAWEKETNIFWQEMDNLVEMLEHIQVKGEYE